MIRSFFDKWIFINYCGQVIGQFSKIHVRQGLINSIVTQVFLLVSIFSVSLPIAFGVRNIFVLLFSLTLTQYYVYKKIKRKLLKLNFHTLRKRYTDLRRYTRILYFIISILFLLITFFSFAFSFYYLQAFIAFW